MRRRRSYGRRPMKRKGASRRRGTSRAAPRAGKGGYRL